MDKIMQNRTRILLDSISNYCPTELRMDDENISKTADHLSENEGDDTEQELETTDEETILRTFTVGQ